MLSSGITSTLVVSSWDLSTTIQDKINEKGEFTMVPERTATNAPSVGIALISLRTTIWEPGSPTITHVCILKKGETVATGQRRLKCTSVIELPETSIDSLIENIPKKFKPYHISKLESGHRNVSEKYGQALLNSLTIHLPEYKTYIDALQGKVLRRNPESSPRTETAAMEKDALGISLDIFGIDRSYILRSWSNSDSESDRSFLNGLPGATIYEDDVISHDLNIFPGFEKISSAITGVVEFKNKEGERLTVINANRKPIERATGVDLIYYHRKYNSFTFIQYKMMDRKIESSGEIYYNPKNKSHNLELERMRNLQTRISEQPKSKILEDFRISECAIFFKLCRKFELKINNSEIAAGAYIPLNHWEILIEDESIKGVNGGGQIGYHTLKKRYLGTQTFVELVKIGYIGTQSLTSKKVTLFIEAAISEGHSVIFSIDNRRK